MEYAHWIEISLIGISLAMDALAVSIAMGTTERKAFDWRKIALVALFFGGFQALMPLAGWFGGYLFYEWIRTFGKYIAAALLAYVGIKMIHDRNSEESAAFSLTRLTVLAFATSIDALLVGVAFACQNMPCIGMEVTLIGCITAVLSAGGCIVGRCFGSIFGNKCAIIGGIVLIGIAVKSIFG